VKLQEQTMILLIVTFNQHSMLTAKPAINPSLKQQNKQYMPLYLCLQVCNIRKIKLTQDLHVSSHVWSNATNF